jgi:hypothetical protein
LEERPPSPTTKECERNAELCLKLARETKEIYAKIALLELAKDWLWRGALVSRWAIWLRQLLQNSTCIASES